MVRSTGDVKTDPDSKHTQKVIVATFTNAMSHLDPVFHPWPLCKCKVPSAGACPCARRSTELEAASQQPLCLSLEPRHVDRLYAWVPASPRGSPDDSDTPLSHAPSPGRGQVVGWPKLVTVCKPWAWTAQWVVTPHLQRGAQLLHTLLQQVAHPRTQISCFPWR